MTLGKKCEKTLVIYLVGIRVNELVKLLRCGETNKPEPQSQHQDDDSNPARRAQQRRCVSCLQDGLIKHLFAREASTSYVCLNGGRALRFGDERMQPFVGSAVPARSSVIGLGLSHRQLQAWTDR